MQIQINSDHTVKTSDAFAEYARKIIEQTLAHQHRQITRIELFLSDVNAGKNGVNDKRCVLEARLAGRKPIAVTAQADTIEAVVSDAAGKLRHVLESLSGKEHDHHPRSTDRNDELDFF